MGWHMMACDLFGTGVEIRRKWLPCCHCRHKVTPAQKSTTTCSLFEVFDRHNINTTIIQNESKSHAYPHARSTIFY